MTESSAQTIKIAPTLEELAADANLPPEIAAVAEKRANILKALADADKASHEASNIRRLAAADTRRFYFSVLAPLATALVAACAFFFQIYQFNQTTLQKLRADQETEWRTAIDNFTQPGPRQTLKSALLLKTFLNSGSHQDEARLFAIRVMKPLVFVDGVEMVFPDIMRHTDWSNLGEVIDWNRRQYEIYTEENGKPEPPARPIHNPRRMLSPAPPSEQQEAGAPEYRDHNLLSAIARQVTIITAGIADFVRSNPRPPNQALDLNSVALIDAHLSGTDLRAAILSDALIQNCDLQGADLSAITDFGGSSWPNSPWWRARKISPGLLDFLKEKYPFNAEESYAGASEKQSDYEAALQRLQQSK